MKQQNKLEVQEFEGVRQEFTFALMINVPSYIREWDFDTNGVTMVSIAVAVDETNLYLFS